VSAAGSVSVVVPVFDEEANAVPLVASIAAALRPLDRPFEIIVVDDGSRDATLARLREQLPSIPELVVVALRRNFGQTLGLQAGFDRARGEVIVTLDGDLQNDPRDIPRLLAEIEDGADVVSGWRRDRKDTLVLRKIPSWIANRMIRAVTGIPIHDQGCALKAYRRTVVRSLDLYADMHRFIAILTMPLGAGIREIEVEHHARIAGESKYGISRVFKVVADLATIQMITRFRRSPLRWFAALGLPFFVAGMASGTLALLTPSIVSSALAVTLWSVFCSCLLMGVLGEAVVAAAPGRRAAGCIAHEWGGER